MSRNSSQENISQSAITRKYAEIRFWSSNGRQAQAGDEVAVIAIQSDITQKMQNDNISEQEKAYLESARIACIADAQNARRNAAPGATPSTDRLENALRIRDALSRDR